MKIIYSKKISRDIASMGTVAKRFKRVRAIFTGTMNVICSILRIIAIRRMSSKFGHPVELRICNSDQFHSWTR